MNYFCILDIKNMWQGNLDATQVNLFQQSEAGHEENGCLVKMTFTGRHLPHWVEQAAHVQRVCPRCSGPGLESRPGALCCVSLLLSLILFPVTSSANLSIKPLKANNILKQQQQQQNSLAP